MPCGSPIVIDERKIKKGCVGSSGAVTSVSALAKDLAGQMKNAASSAGGGSSTASMVNYMANTAGGVIKVYKAADKTGNAAISLIKTGRRVTSEANRLIRNSRVTVRTSIDLGPLQKRVRTMGVRGVSVRTKDHEYKTTYRRYVKSKIKTRLKNTVAYKAGKTIKTDVGSDLKIIKGVIRKNTRITAAGVKKLQKGTGKELAKATGKILVRNVGRNTVRTLRFGGKTAKWAIKKTPAAVRKTVKAGAVGLDVTSKVMIDSDDAAIRATGYYLKGVHTSGKLIKTSALGAKAGTKVAVRTAKGIPKRIRTVKTGFSYVRKNGIAKAARKAGGKLAKGAANAVRKGVSAVIRGLMSHLLVPLLVIVMVAAGAVVVIGGTGAVVGSVFGGVTTVVSGFMEKVGNFFHFGDDKEEEDKPVDVVIEEYLRDKIKESRKQMRKDIMRSLKEKGSYDEVRFYNKELDMDIPIDPDAAKSEKKINRLMYSDDAIMRMISPMFNARVVAEYGLVVPKKSDLDDMYDEIADDIFVVNSEDYIEYCTPDVCPSCGQHHASDGCPQAERGFHSDTAQCHDCCRSEHTICAGHLTDEYGCGIEEHDHYNAAEDKDTNWEDARDYFKAHPSEDGTVWCNWELVDGSGNVPSVTCHLARYYECGGHTHTDSCRKTKYHWGDGSFREERPSGDDANIDGAPCDNSENKTSCTGYSYCKGHKIKRIYIKPKDAEELIEDNYTKKIDELKKDVEKQTKKVDKAKGKKKPKQDDIDKEQDELTKLEQQLSSMVETRDLTYAFLEIIDDELGLGDEEEDADAKKLANMEITNKFAARAAEQAGKPFVFEGEDPNVGFDDLGLVKYVYGQTLGDVTSYGELYANGGFDFEHTYEDDTAGALLLYSYGSQKDKKYDPDNIYHVGISLGNGYMVHAAGSPAAAGKPGGSVKVSKVSAAVVLKIGIPKEEILN